MTKTDHNIATDTFSSPSHKLISNVESLFCIRKEEILSNSETIEETCSQLTEDTGIDFLAQIGRIGNIEWYTLPSGNIRDISHVQFSTIVDREKQSCTQVKITISKEAPGEYLVNARCTNGKAIVCDTIYPATVTDTPIDLVFSASEQITTIKVTIWKKISDAWSLWHEKDNHLNRQMHLSLTIHVGGGVVESRGLDELKKHQKLLTRVDDVRKFSLSQPASSSIIGNNSLDPWRQTIYAASDKIKFLTPKKSNALFLPKDWNGRMEFFEWLKATPSRGANIKEIIIIDPFMEEEAVRFIPRFGNIGISYTLIANTKAAKDPDIRRAAIQAAADHVFKNLRSIKVEIYDVIKEKQIIHDRYIILKNSDGFFCHGYNLSNSIQSANQNFPLLITEIPQDALLAIQDWLAITLDEELEKIWATADLNATRKRVPVTHEANAYPDLSTNDILAMTPSQWGEVCENAYNNNSSSKSMWDAAAAFSQEQINALCSNVFTYLDEGKDIDMANESKALFEYLKSTEIAAIIESGELFFDQLPPIYHLPPSLHYVAEMLVRRRPDAAISLYQKIKYSSQDLPPHYALFFHKFFYSLKLSLDFNEGNVQPWLDCGEPHIVGFAASCLGSKVMRREIDLPSAVAMLAIIPEETRFQILLQWIYEFRAISNRNNYNGSFEKELIVLTFKELQTLWPEQASLSFMKALLIRAGGPGNGGWATSTVNELFFPLLETGKINISDLCKVLHMLCKEHLVADSIFSQHTSAGVFEAFSCVLAQIEDDERTHYINEFDAQIKEAIRELGRPFAMSISYKKYSNFSTFLHKILCVFFAHNRYRFDEEIKQRLSTICSFLKQMDLLGQASCTALNTAVTQEMCNGQ